MPAAPRAWSDPFLEQAREDLKAAWSVSSEVSPSTLCMLLQMVFEKLAKAAYARSGYVVPRTHEAATHLFAVLLRHPAGTVILQAAPHVQQFVMELEAAQPTLAGRSLSHVLSLSTRGRTRSVIRFTTPQETCLWRAAFRVHGIALRSTV